MTEEKPSLVGDPEDPLAYLKEFVEGDASHNPDKLARAYLILAQQKTGLEQQVFQALAWAVGATRTESRVNSKMRALEVRVRALEERLGKSGGPA
jgi:hypothetical protein